MPGPRGFQDPVGEAFARRILAMPQGVKSERRGLFVEFQVLHLEEERHAGTRRLVRHFDAAGSAEWHGKLAVVAPAGATEGLGDVMGVFPPGHAVKVAKGDLDRGAFLSIPEEAQYQVVVEIVGQAGHGLHRCHPDAQNHARSLDLSDGVGLAGPDLHALARCIADRLGHHFGRFLPALAADLAHFSLDRGDQIR